MIVDDADDALAGHDPCDVSQRECQDYVSENSTHGCSSHGGPVSLFFADIDSFYGKT